MRVEYFVAIVDRTDEWGPIVETRLKREIKDPYQVLAFHKTNQLLDLINKHTLRIPLLTIADTDAVTPKPSEGLFAQVEPIVGRCLNIYYSANPTPEILQELSWNSTFRLVSRIGKDSIKRLAEMAKEKIESIENSADYKLIKMYEGYISNIDNGNIATVDDEELTPIKMLSEMARGSIIGQRYLQQMIPRSWEMRK